MTRFVRITLIVFVAFGVAGSLQHTEAQIVKRLRDRAKAKVEEKIGQKQDEAIDNLFDGRAADADDDVDTPQSNPAAVESTAIESAAVESPASSTEATGGDVQKLKPGEGAWANYDFVPGERPIYVNDFMQDRVGNFPQRMEFRSGNMQLVEWNGKRWLSAEGGELYINLSESLPERFTMEFDLAGSGNGMEIGFSSDEHNQSHQIQIGDYYARLRSGLVDARGDLRVNTAEEPVRISISFDGQYVKLYANEYRALNVPNANLGRSNRIYMNLNGWSADDPRMIADIRVMAGGTPMYDALIAEGRFATQGILFDTGSDVIRPESTPTLKEIGEMLKQHADLRLRIEGHTDDVGDDAANQRLSERRAAAVKAFLQETYQIDAARLEAQGFGETQPVAPNDTPEGRQQNRRVELVKL